MKKIHSFLTAAVALLAAAAAGIGSRINDALFSYMARTGAVLGLDPIPDQAEFQMYRATNPNFAECIKQPLYDYQLLAGAGSQQLTFFQAPRGQGLTTALGATVGTPKTTQDTNMDLAGQLPSGLEFMALSIEVLFYPGSVSTANTYTPATVGFYNAAATLALIAPNVNDPNTFYQSGLLRFKVLNKDYLVQAPLINFVPRASFDLQAAISTATTANTIGMAVLRPGGEIYYLNPPISLQSTVNFAITLEWPAVVAMPSGFNARVGVQLNGWQLRAGQ